MFYFLYFIKYNIAMNKEKEIINTEYGEYDIEPLISTIGGEEKILSLTLHFPSVINGYSSRRSLWGFITITDDGEITYFTHMLGKDQKNENGWCTCKNLIHLYGEIAESHALVSMEAIEKLIDRAKEAKFRFY